MNIDDAFEGFTCSSVSIYPDSSTFGRPTWKDWPTPMDWEKDRRNWNTSI